VQRNDNMGDPEADGRLIRERLLNKQGVKWGVNSCGCGSNPATGCCAEVN
jgi:hypothetical protein